MDLSLSISLSFRQWSWYPCVRRGRCFRWPCPCPSSLLLRRPSLAWPRPLVLDLRPRPGHPPLLFPARVWVYTFALFSHCFLSNFFWPSLVDFFCVVNKFFFSLITFTIDWLLLLHPFSPSLSLFLSLSLSSLSLSLSLSLSQSSDWVVTPDIKAKYDTYFEGIDNDRDGIVNGEQARGIFMASGLPSNVLAHVWLVLALHKLSSICNILADRS